MVDALRIFKFIVPPAFMAAAMAVATAGPAQEAASHQAAPGPAGRIKKVGVVADAALDERARYGIRRLEAALRSKGIAVSEGGSSRGRRSGGHSHRGAISKEARHRPGRRRWRGIDVRRARSRRSHRLG